MEAESISSFKRGKYNVVDLLCESKFGEVYLIESNKTKKK